MQIYLYRDKLNSFLFFEDFFFLFSEMTVPDAGLVKTVALVDMKDNEIIESQKEMQSTIQKLSDDVEVRIRF